MKLRAQVVGVNEFLTALYSKEIRLSTLLARLGYKDQQIEMLRTEHLEEIVPLFLALLKERIVAGSDSERLYQILSGRFGLDGHPPVTLKRLGEYFGVSRERIRQLQVKALRRCRVPARRRSLEAGLRDIAAALLADYNTDPSGTKPEDP